MLPRIVIAYSQMTFTQKTFVSFVVALILSALIAISFGTLITHASSPPGLPATIATTSPMAVTTTPSLVMATSSCSARIITTTASPIMIGFSDIQGFLPSGTQGHLQAASSTVAYDSGQYGCGAVRVYSFVAGQITISESR